MKITFKKILAGAMLASLAVTAMAESYQINSIDGSTLLTVSLQGGGTAKIGGPLVSQDLTLNADHTMTGRIFATNEGEDTDLFLLSGIWYRPPSSKVIYYAIDGDPTKGQNSDGTWGALFDPAKAAIMNLQGFMPVLFGTKVTSIEPIYPTIFMKTGLIKLSLNGDTLKGATTLSLNGDTIKGATTDMTIVGRAMASYCKVDKTDTCVPTVTKDASFGFSSKTKSTVEQTDM